MTIEQVRQQIIDDGKNPDDYSIFISENGYSVWKKEHAPNWMKSAEQQAEYGDLQVLAELYYELMKAGE